MRAVKIAGPQTCDSCGREFTASRPQGVLECGGKPRVDWTCPHCGFDNRVGEEFGRHGEAVAAERFRQGRKT